MIFKKKKRGKVVNQNDILEIIKSDVERIKDITDIIIDASIHINNSDLKNVNFDSLNIIFGDDGFLIKTYSSLNKFKKLSGFRGIYKKVASYFDVIQMILYRISAISNRTNITKSKKDPEFLKQYLLSIFDVVSSISNYPITKLGVALRIRIWFIRRAINKLFGVIKQYGDFMEGLRGDVSATTRVKLLETAMGGIMETLKFVSEIKINLGIYIKLFILNSILNRLIKLINKISDSDVDYIGLAKSIVLFSILNDIVSNISNIVTNIKNIKIGALLTTIIKISMLSMVFNVLISLVLRVDKKMKANKLISSVLKVNLLGIFIEEIVTISDMLKNTKIGLSLIFKTILLGWFMTTLINRLVLFSELTKKINFKTTILNIMLMKLLFEQLYVIVLYIRSMRLGIYLSYKIWRLKSFIKKLSGVLEALSEMSRKSNISISLLKNLFIARLTMILLNGLLDVVLSLPGGFFARRKLKGISKSILIMGDIVRRINRLRITRRTVRKINLLSALFGEISKIMILIVLMTPILLAFAISVVIFVGAVWVLSIAVSIIMKLVKHMIKGRVVIGTLLLISFIGILVLLGLAMVGLSVIAVMVVGSILEILKLMGLIVAMVALTALMGFLFSLILPVAIPILLGLGFMVIIVGAILLISWMLLKIQEMNLDPNIIKNNVDTVINTCLMIIDSIFGTTANSNNSGSESWMETIISGTLGIAGTMIKAMMAVGFLMISLVSIGLVLLLAGQLALLQKLDLKPDIVINNVNLVISTCLSVIDSIFNREEKEDNPSNKNWIVSVIEYVGGGIAKIIGAIMAVRFLAISIVTIGLITILATQLRILQELELDPNIITTNVNLVISTCLSVIDSIFNREEEDTNPSNKNWIVSVIEYVGGGITKIISAIMAVGFLAVSVVAVGLITILAKQLKTIQDIELDTNAISGKITLILNTSKMVLNTLKTDMGDILGAENTKRTSLISWMFPKLADLASILSSIGMLSLALVAVGSLAQIATNLKTIQEIGDLNGVDKKTTMILNVATKVINTMKKNIEDVDIDADEVIEKMSAADKMADIVTKFIKLDDKYVNNSTKATDNFVKFIDKINTTDLSKLNATAKLFQNMSKFSESIRGNFEGLADALNEKIAPLLEELKDLLTDIPNTINTSSDKISQTVVNNSPKENITPEKARKNAELFGAPGTKENEKMVKQQMVEKEEKDREKRRIEDILMDIKDILNGTGAYTAGVKTR